MEKKYPSSIESTVNSDTYETSFITPKVNSAKIVSTPTSNSWSQAYSAGSLYAVVALSNTNLEEVVELNAIGKNILNSLEEEFFVLEEKNLASIKQAIATVLQKIPQEYSLSISFLVTYFSQKIQNPHHGILYAFLVGKGSIQLVRKGKFGTLLHSANKLLATSGFLEDEDIIVLQSESFYQTISQEVLLATLQDTTLQDASEILAPKIHQAELGDATAIIISYKNPPISHPDVSTEERIIPSELPDRESPEETVIQEPHTKRKKMISLLHFSSMKNPLGHSKKIFLSISLLIIFILISSAYFAIQKREESRRQAILQSILPAAQKKYDEGQALITLNQNVARQDLQDAKTILDTNSNTFPKNTSEYMAIQNLLQKVNQTLLEASNIQSTTAKEVPDSSDQLLSYELHAAVLFATQDDKTIYAISKTNITGIDKATKKESILVKNDSIWSDVAGIGQYNGNLYVLDKKSNQIFKFIPSGTTYAQASYLASNIAPDFSKVQSMTVDTSVWVLYQDGTITEYTRGKPSDFKISGLDKALVNPTHILTTADANNIYILDSGNQRIVVLNKNGSYQAQYQSKILMNAKDFTIYESTKSIFFISSGKIYEITMK